MIEKANSAYPTIVGRNPAERWRWSLRDFLQEVRVPDDVVIQLCRLTETWNWAEPEKMHLTRPIPLAVMESFRIPMAQVLAVCRREHGYLNFLFGDKCKELELFDRATHCLVDALTMYDDRIRAAYSHWKPFIAEDVKQLREQGYGTIIERATLVGSKRPKKEEAKKSRRTVKEKRTGSLRPMASNPNGKRKGVAVRKRRVDKD